MADYIDRDKLKEDSEYNPVSGEYLSYSRGQVWNASVEKVIDISVLDKIKAEIESITPKAHIRTGKLSIDAELMIPLDKVLNVIDKYKVDSEE